MKVTYDGLVARINQVKCPKSSVRELLIAALKSYDDNATFFALLCLCPKVRILQISVPTREFGRSLSSHYQTQHTKSPTPRPPFPPIDTIDILDSPWTCLCHDVTLRRIAPYFLVSGVRSLIARNVLADVDGQPLRLRGKSTLKDVFLRGKDISPEALAEMMRQVPKLEDCCYEDSDRWSSFAEAGEDGSITRGAKAFVQRLCDVAREMFEEDEKVVTVHEDRVYVRDDFIEISTRCGLGCVLSRPTGGAVLRRWAVNRPPVTSPDESDND